MPNKGWNPSPETRAKWSAALVGNTNHTGKKASAETRARQSIAQKARDHAGYSEKQKEIMRKHLAEDNPNCDCYGHKWRSKSRGFCLLCLRDDVPLCQDHDHGTGQLRGKICMQCNMALGMIHDDTGTLERMLRYLNKFREVAESKGFDPDRAVEIASRVSITMK